VTRPAPATPPETEVRLPPYRPRRLAFLALVECHQLTLKTCSISTTGEAPSAETVAAATPMRLASSADTNERAAWLRHVLTPSGSGDVRAYLEDVLNAEI
jgi:hypothetical protein